MHQAHFLLSDANNRPKATLDIPPLRPQPEVELIKDDTSEYSIIGIHRGRDRILSGSSGAHTQRNHGEKTAMTFRATALAIFPENER